MLRTLPIALLGLALAAALAGCAPAALTATPEPRASAPAATGAPTRPASAAAPTRPPALSATPTNADSSAGAASATAAPGRTTLPEAVPSATPPALSGGEAQGGTAPDELVAQAVADLAARSGAPAGEITLVLAEAVVWNDGSLGCPERGVVYTQALVPGFRILLSWRGEVYDYRADERLVRLCERRS